MQICWSSQETVLKLEKPATCANSKEDHPAHPKIILTHSHPISPIPYPSLNPNLLYLPHHTADT